MLWCRVKPHRPFQKTRTRRKLKKDFSKTEILRGVGDACLKALKICNICDVGMKELLRDRMEGKGPGGKGPQCLGS